MLSFIIFTVSDGLNEVIETIVNLRKPFSVLGRDIELFVSLCLARLIVWHEVHKAR